MTALNIDLTKAANIVGQLEKQGTKDEQARIKLMHGLSALGVTPDMMASDHASKFHARAKHAILVAWQGEDFAKWMESKEGKPSRTGSIINPQTGAKARVSLTRREWSQRLGSKMAKFKAAFTRYCDGPTEGGARSGGGREPAQVDFSKVAEVRKRIQTLAASDKDADKAKLAAYGDAAAILKGLDVAIAAFSKAARS